MHASLRRVWDRRLNLRCPRLPGAAPRSRAGTLIKSRCAAFALPCVRDARNVATGFHAHASAVLLLPALSVYGLAVTQGTNEAWTDWVSS